MAGRSDLRAVGGTLDQAPMRIDELFGFAVPLAIDGIDPKLLTPRQTWADGDAYDAKAAYLAGLFQKNFQKFGANADASAGPRLAQAAE